MNPNPFVELVTSKKTLVALVAIVAVVVLCALGRLTGDAALDFTKWVLGVWLAAQALVDSKMKPLYLAAKNASTPPAATGEGAKE